MSRIHHVAVEQFWDAHDFEFKLDPYVNFFIGQNGTGKTTLINLVAAALTADFRALDRISFRKLTIALRNDTPAQNVSITVSKEIKKEKAFDAVKYSIKFGPRASQEVTFSLEDIEEEYLIRRLSSDFTYRNQLHRRLSSDILEKLNELVVVNWLSIHRTSSADKSREDKSFESTVDIKLSALSNELVKLFATFSKQKDDEVRQFQEAIFLSLLEPEPASADGLAFSRLEKLDQHKETLANIFRELRVDDSKTRGLINMFAERGEQISAKLDRTRKKIPSIRLEDIIFINSMKRIDDIVERWKKLQLQLEAVFAQQDRFLKITNELLQRKKMEIADNNELKFISRSGKILTPQMLSSGEKQLLILLSETLLQKEAAAIFIADEPELSLHVLWQEKLVGSLRALNPSTQIIIATHSPDIVGALGEYAIDMENLIP